METKDDDTRFAEIVMDAVDTGGGQTTDVRKVMIMLFALPPDVRAWLAAKLSEPSPTWDWKFST